MLISSCVNIDLKANFRDADTIIISFYGFKENELNKEYLILEFTSKEEIAKIINFISKIPAPLYKCAYQGAIDIFKNGESILNEKMEFNISEDCQHIIFIYNTKLISRKITNDGINFLRMYYDKIPVENKIF